MKIREGIIFHLQNQEKVKKKKTKANHFIFPVKWTFRRLRACLLLITASFNAFSQVQRMVPRKRSLEG
jgi:hypothetical protein